MFLSLLSDLPVRVKLGESSWPKSPTYTSITPPSTHTPGGQQTVSPSPTYTSITLPSTRTPGGQQTVSQSAAPPSILRSPSAQPYI